MPKIIQNEKQTEALREIGEDLETLRKIVEVQNQSEGGKVSVSAIERRKGARGATVEVDDNVAAKIMKALSGQAKDVAKGIVRLAKTFHIQLDDDEEALVSRAMSETRGSVKQASEESDDPDDDEQDASTSAVDPLFAEELLYDD